MTSFFTRKARTAALQAGRELDRHRPSRRSAGPPILANSFPKSGTNLVVQMLGAFPTVRNYDSLWINLPAITYRARGPEAMVGRIRRVAPGELVAGHVFHAPEVKASLAERGVVHYFLVRDPRDVAVSEAHYLGDMNWRHRMHRVFGPLSPGQRLHMAISGHPGEVAPGVLYPGIAQRFKPFEPWLADPDVLVVRFEDLVGPAREATLVAMARHYLERSHLPDDAREVARRAAAAVAPSRSHTFRRGQAAAWRQEFTAGHTEAMKAEAGDLLVRLGYEQSQEW